MLPRFVFNFIVASPVPSVPFTSLRNRAHACLSSFNVCGLSVIKCSDTNFPRAVRARTSAFTCFGRASAILPESAESEMVSSERTFLHEVQIAPFFVCAATLLLAFSMVIFPLTALA